MTKRTSTRATQGSGTIRQRPDGRWEARYTVGRDPGTGADTAPESMARRRRKCVSASSRWRYPSTTEPTCSRRGWRWASG